MALARWDPLREGLSLRDAMDRLFEESFIRTPRVWQMATVRGVPIDMRETDDELIITAEVPGIKADDVDIQISDGTLTMKGVFKAEHEEEAEEGNFVCRERRYGEFQRSVMLPTQVDADKAEAEFRDGVLTVTMPKAEDVKPKRIEIKVK